MYGLTHTLLPISAGGGCRLQEAFSMVWCPSYPPSVCSATEGDTGGVMQRPSGSRSVSNTVTDRQCNPRLFGAGRPWR
jgi:hypothetical protein